MKLRVLAGVAAGVMVVAGVVTGGPARAADVPYPVGYDFLVNTVRIGTADSAPGENDWSCRPTAARDLMLPSSSLSGVLEPSA